MINTVTEEITVIFIALRFVSSGTLRFGSVLTNRSEKRKMRRTRILAWVIGFQNESSSNRRNNRDFYL
jgi:hypothetical protein